MFSTPIASGFSPPGMNSSNFIWIYTRGGRAGTKTIDQYFDMVKIRTGGPASPDQGYSHGMKNKVQMLCFLDCPAAGQSCSMSRLTSFDVVVALEIKQLLREIKHDHILVFLRTSSPAGHRPCADEIVVLTKRAAAADRTTPCWRARTLRNKSLSLLKDEESQRAKAGSII